MDVLKTNEEAEKRNQKNSVEDNFPNFFAVLPERYRYLNNLDYLKKCKIKITDRGMELFNKERVVGIINFNIIDQPIKHCLLTNLNVEDKFLGKKYGSLLIELFNYFLQTKRLIGVLQNGVDIIGEAVDFKTNMTSNFYGLLRFYQDHGWQVLSTVNGVPCYMVYNCNEEDINKLKKVYGG